MTRQHGPQQNCNALNSADISRLNTEVDGGRLAQPLWKHCGKGRPSASMRAVALKFYRFAPRLYGRLIFALGRAIAM